MSVIASVNNEDGSSWCCAVGHGMPLFCFSLKLKFEDRSVDEACRTSQALGEVSRISLRLTHRTRVNPYVVGDLAKFTQCLGVLPQSGRQDGVDLGLPRTMRGSVSPDFWPVGLDSELAQLLDGALRKQSNRLPRGDHRAQTPRAAQYPKLSGSLPGLAVLLLGPSSHNRLGPDGAAPALYM